MSAMDKVQEEMEMDMTPMIDCVFLLLIFFVLVIDLSQQNLEDLILPKAKKVEEDKGSDKVRPIVNISQDGDVVYKQQYYYTAATDGEDYSGMERLLKEWRRDLKLDMRPLHEFKPLSKTNPEVPYTPVLVRADKWTEWHYVGKFMTFCSQPYAQFWKLELAMSEIDKEEKMLKAFRARGN